MTRDKNIGNATVNVNDIIIPTVFGNVGNYDNPAVDGIMISGEEE